MQSSVSYHGVPRPWQRCYKGTQISSSSFMLLGIDCMSWVTRCSAVRTWWRLPVRVYYRLMAICWPLVTNDWPRLTTLARACVATVTLLLVVAPRRADLWWRSKIRVQLSSLSTCLVAPRLAAWNPTTRRVLGPPPADDNLQRLLARRRLAARCTTTVNHPPALFYG